VKSLIFPFEMPIGAKAKIVKPDYFAKEGIVIRRDSEITWSQVDNPNCTWTDPYPGGNILVELE
jgi:hypothetical protein